MVVVVVVVVVIVIVEVKAFVVVINDNNARGLTLAPLRLALIGRGAARLRVRCGLVRAGGLRRLSVGAVRPGL